jgi:hypothetical protein
MRPGHAQGVQQVAHEGRLACAQRALQLDVGAAHGRPGREPGRCGGAIALVGPDDASAF